MRILHISFHPKPQYHDPKSWLQRIDFFVAILKKMAVHHEVLNFDLLNYSGSYSEDGVTYHFRKPGVAGSIVPWRIARFLARRHPDVVIVHGLLFPWQVLWLRLAMPRRVRFFVQHHAEHPLRFHRATLQRMLDRSVDGYFFVAPEQAAAWRKKGLIRDQHKIHYVMEVASVFKPTDRQAARSTLGIAGETIYLWVGRLDKNKDPLTAIEAFVEFSKSFPVSVLYMIHTDGPLAEAVSKKLQTLPEDRIVLRAHVPHPEMALWFNSADYIISTSHYEGSGVAVAEGMSCGCFPVVTNIPSFRMMTGEGSAGLLFEPGDVRGLVQALMKSITFRGPETRRRVHHHYEAFLSADAIAKKMLDVIERA